MITDTTQISRRLGGARGRNVRGLFRSLHAIAALLPLLVLPQAGAAAQNDVGEPRALSVPVFDPSTGTENRLALVIGNSAYPNSPLTNPVNDARAMSAKLRELGFTVIEKLNVSRREIEQASRDFGNRLKLGGVGLFYFAGHGVQSSGSNFLLSVDSDIQDDSELQARAYNVSEILGKMDAAKNRLNVVILDACRNNPLLRTSRGTQKGLAMIQQGTGTIIGYATQPGATAADGPAGGNSLYTQQLLLALSQPGLRVEDVFKQVRVEVIRRSKGAQTPWENSSLVGEFYFNRGAKGAAVEPTLVADVPDEEYQDVSEQRMVRKPSPPLVVIPRKVLETYQLAANMSMPSLATVARFSRDDARLAIATEDRQIRIWDTVTGSLVSSHDGFGSAAVSRDGRYLVGVGDDFSVNLLDLGSPMPAVRTIRGTDARRAEVFAASGRLLVIARSGAASLFDLESARSLAPPVTKVVGDPRVDVSNSETRAVISGGPQSETTLVNLENGKKLARISSNGKAPQVIAFSADGGFLLTSFEGGDATVWRTSDGKPVSKLVLGGGKASLQHAQFVGSTPEILGYLTRSDPKTGIHHQVSVWSATTGKVAIELASGTALVRLSSAAGGQQAYYALADSTVYVYEAATRVKRKALSDASLVAISADGQRFLARESDGLRLYDGRTLTPIARMPGQTGAFVQEGGVGLFASVAPDGGISLWDLEHGEPIAQLRGHIDAVEQVVFAPSGKRLLSLGKGRTSKLWSLPEVSGIEKLKRDQFESTADYTRRVGEWTAQYTTLVSLGDYNADSESYAVRVGDVTLNLPTPRDDARRFAGQREAVLTGRLRVHDAEQLQLDEGKLSRLP